MCIHVYMQKNRLTPHLRRLAKSVDCDNRQPCRIRVRISIGNLGFSLAHRSRLSNKSYSVCYHTVTLPYFAKYVNL